MIKTYSFIEWEKFLVAEYRRFVGISVLDMQHSYLKYVREWPIYGSVFFPACKDVPPEGFFELRTDHHLICVNSDGIFVIDDDNHKIIVSEMYDNIAWDISHDYITLEYGPQNKPILSTFITPQIKLVDDMASKAVEVIEKLIAAEENDRIATT
jgi:hypothetical protein